MPGGGDERRYWSSVARATVRPSCVSLARRPSDRELRQLRAGVGLDDGPTLPAKVTRRGASEIEITLREGRNRQVRRMAEAIGNRVASLQRVAFGSLHLGSLAEGASRRLSAEEIDRLWVDSQPDE